LGRRRRCTSLVTRLRSEATPSTRAFDDDFPSSTAESFWFWLFAPFPPLPPNHTDPNPGERAPRPCAVAERGASANDATGHGRGLRQPPHQPPPRLRPRTDAIPTRLSASLVSLGIVADLGWFVSAGYDTGRQETQSPRRPRL
jgi:hypothetical protein